MDIEQLIREVHARPEVWNQKSINYYNRDIVAKKWVEIAKACDMPCEAVRCKWKHLRDHFRKEFKKNMDTKDKDQSEKYESQWVWYKNLWFLGDQLMTKKITQHQPLFGALIKDRKSMNDENSKEDSEENLAACSQDDHLTTSTFEDDLNHSLQDDSSMESKGKLFSAHFAECESGTKRKKAKYFNNISHHSSDDTYHFLMSLMTPLKYLPYDRQMLVRLKIQSIVTDEVAKLQNDGILYPVELKANYSDENSSPLSPDVVISDMSCDNENLYK